MERNIVVTPNCPICLKNYSSTCIPKIAYPCGHGMCGECILDYRQHNEEDNELKCPICREVIVQDFENYDLQYISNNVNTDVMSYWSRRLLEIVESKGSTVQIHEKMLPFCRTIFTRLVYRDDFKILGIVDHVCWTHEDRQKINRLSRTFLKALACTNSDAEEALNWVHVLNVPTSVESILIRDVNRFYNGKNFLETMDGEWLLDSLLV